MSGIESLSLRIGCPACGVPQRLGACWRSGSPGGAMHAVLRECTRCWSARARALNEERAMLRATGELTGDGARLTWRGERLSGPHAADGLASALLSALLRRDVAAIPWARLELPEAVPEEAVATAG